jgi:hypothetical protein
MWRIQLIKGIHTFGKSGIVAFYFKSDYLPISLDDEIYLLVAISPIPQLAFPFGGCV